MDQTVHTNANPPGRAELAAALQVAKTWSAQTLGVGSFKKLGPLVRTSPTRLADLASATYCLPLEMGKVATNGKTVVGFAASVYRTVHWLVSHNYGKVAAPVGFQKWVESLGTGSEGSPRFALAVVTLIGEYWPQENITGIQPGDELVRGWIETGINTASQALENEDALSIAVSVIEWGPFSFVPKSAPSATSEALPPPILNSFLVKYGSSALSTIDPVRFDLSAKDLFSPKSLKDALESVPDSQPGKWQAILGLYDSLFRQYDGFRFVTFPIRVPVVGLLLSKGVDQQPSHNNFIDTFCDQGVAMAYAVDRESGHLFLGRLRSNSKIAPISLENSSAENVLSYLLERLNESGEGRLGFVSDSVLCFELLRQWELMGLGAEVSLRILPQKNGSQSEFSFRTGFMVREEDSKLITMLQAAQLEMFRSEWKVHELFRLLISSTREWISSLGQNSKNWPGPFFALNGQCLTELAPSEPRKRRLLEIINQEGDGLFDIGEDIEFGGEK